MSRPIKRSVAIRGHRTSFCLEPEFWDELKRLAEARGLSLAALISEVDAARGEAPGANLSSALRVFVLQMLRVRSETPTSTDR